MSVSIRVSSNSSVVFVISNAIVLSGWKSIRRRNMAISARCVSINVPNGVPLRITHCRSMVVIWPVSTMQVWLFFFFSAFNSRGPVNAFITLTMYELHQDPLGRKREKKIPGKGIWSVWRQFWRHWIDWGMFWSLNFRFTLPSAYSTNGHL